MKRLVSTVLALSLLGTAAASAQPFRGQGGYDAGIQRDDSWSQTRDGSYRGNYDTHRDYRGSDRRRGHNDNNALLGVGIGLFVLAAIAASQHNANDAYRSNDRYYFGH